MKAVNLIPSEQREGAAVGAGHSEGGAYAVLGVLAGVALLALLYGMASREISSRRSQAATISAQAQSAQAAATQLAPYTSFVALREQRTQAVTTLVESRFDWAHAFHEFGRVVPPGVSFNTLDGAIGVSTSSSSSISTSTPAASSTSPSSTATTTAPATPVTSATPPGAVPTFTLAGCALSQELVAAMLERLRLIDGVNEVTLQSSTASSSSGGSGSGGGCSGHDPAFSVTITFDALPTPSASTSTASTSTVADSATASGSASSTAATGSSAR